jgi:hypothetical protein
MRIHKYLTIVIVLVGLHAHSQTPTSGAIPAEAQNSATGTEDSTKQVIEEGNFTPTIPSDAESAMQTPAPVNAGGYSMAFPSESARSNYLNMGLNLMSAYDDNALGNTAGRRVTDTSYSVRPVLSWRQSTSRVLWNFTYSPGFTFYQHFSALNSADHNLSVDSQFRLSPHVTLRLLDGFSKSSNPIGQFYESASTPAGIAQPPVATIISPLADQISNSGSVQLTYQFGRNSMVGASGLFSILRYLNREQVPGLFDSDTKAAQGFYAHRISSKHYVGMRYEFQNLLSKPNPVNTQTQSLVLFYTIYVQPRMSVSLFAGPQHSDTRGGDAIPSNMWSPSFGGSFGWQGVRTSLAIEASRAVTAGGGLQGASRSDSADASVRRQLTKSLGVEAGASFSKSDVLASLSTFSSGGHSVSGSISLYRQIREHLNLVLAYVRLHQSYGDIQALSSDPNRNRVSLSLSYQFQRPIGR